MSIVSVSAEVYGDLERLAATTGRSVDAVADSLLRATGMAVDVAPPDGPSIVVAAARELLASERDPSRLRNVSALVTGTSVEVLFGLALKFVNAVGLAAHGDDVGEWDGELASILRRLAVERAG